MKNIGDNAWLLNFDFYTELIQTIYSLMIFFKARDPEQYVGNPKELNVPMIMRNLTLMISMQV